MASVDIGVVERGNLRADDVRDAESVDMSRFGLAQLLTTFKCGVQSEITLLPSLYFDLGIKSNRLANAQIAKIVSRTRVRKRSLYIRRREALRSIFTTFD